MAYMSSLFYKLDCRWANVTKV